MKMKLLAHAIATIGVLGSIAAYADEAPAKPATASESQLERVEIVGSNIKRINKEGPSRVEVIKRSEIEQTGATTVAGALAVVAPSSDVALGTDSASFAAGAASVGLRHMGSQNTLVLLNGRRVAPYGIANFSNSAVDLNSIPLSAIDEIQVLYDGASAIYGSDAVAGVVNFITKKNFQGVESTATYGQNFDGDGNGSVAGLAAGFGDLDKDGRNLLLSLDVMHMDPTWSSKHDATSNRDFRRLGGLDGRATGLNPGTYKFYQEAYNHAMPGCTGEVSTDKHGDEACRTNTDVQLGPRATRTSLGANYKQKLGAETYLFGELQFTHGEASFNAGPLSIDAYNHIINPGDAAYRPVIGGNDGGGDRILATRNVYEGPSDTTTVKSDMLRGVFGLSSQLGNWDSEAALTYSSNKATQQETVLLKDQITAAYKNGGYDPFALWNPKNVVDPLFTNVTNQGKATLTTLDAKMSNPSLFALPTGDVGFAWGASLMHEYANGEADPQLIAGKIDGRGATSAEGSRNIHSLYGEFNIPGPKKLEVQLALRYDHYSDFGSTTNPKVAFSFQPIKQVLLRGGATTTFKAPSMQQLHMGPSKAYTSAGIADWDRCKPLGYAADQCKYYPELRVVSNPNLKPERANNFNLGMVLQPTDDLSATLDWYKIEQRDAIRSMDVQYIVDGEDSNPALASLIERLPRNKGLEAKYPGLNKGRLNRVTDPFINVGHVTTSGIDTDVKYLLKMGDLGRLTFRNQLSYLLTFEQSDVEGAPLTDRRDGRDFPNWVNRFTLEYEAGKWDTLLTANTYARVHDVSDGSKVNSNNSDSFMPSYSTFDAAVSYKFTKKNKVTFGIGNLTNKVAPYSPDLGDYVGVKTGRSFFVTADYKFK